MPPDLVLTISLDSFTQASLKIDMLMLPTELVTKLRSFKRVTPIVTWSIWYPIGFIGSACQVRATPCIGKLVKHYYLCIRLISNDSSHEVRTHDAHSACYKNLAERAFRIMIDTHFVHPSIMPRRNLSNLSKLNLYSNSISTKSPNSLLISCLFSSSNSPPQMIL